MAHPPEEDGFLVVEEGDDAADDDGALRVVRHVQEDLREAQQHDHDEDTRHQAGNLCAANHEEESDSCWSPTSQHHKFKVAIQDRRTLAHLQLRHDNGEVTTEHE